MSPGMTCSARTGQLIQPTFHKPNYIQHKCDLRFLYLFPSIFFQESFLVPNFRTLFVFLNCQTVSGESKNNADLVIPLKYEVSLLLLFRMSV